MYGPDPLRRQLRRRLPASATLEQARARISRSCTSKIRAEIDALFAGEVDLPGVLEQVARLGARPG